jgi:hypothetical protein
VPIRASKTVTTVRVEEILQLRLLGAEFVDIRKHSQANGWNLADRSLHYLIAKSDKLLQQTLEKDRTKIINRHIAMRRALYARAVAVSDYGTASRILRDEAELLGLYPAKKMDVRGGPQLQLNVFERINERHQQLLECRTVEPGIPAGSLRSDSMPAVDLADSNSQATPVPHAG